MAAKILLLSSLYFFMPVVRLPVRHALIGGATAGQAPLHLMVKTPAFLSTGTG